MVANAAPPAPPFDFSTRRKIVPMAAIPRPTGGGPAQGVQLPKTGLLAGIHLRITGTVGGTVGTVNALGMASIIRRVRLTANSGIQLIDVSGPGYHYLLRPMLESEYIDVCGQSNAQDAVTATAANLDMWLPLCVNMRDPVGLIMLQNEQTIITLNIDWEADTAVTSTGTFSSFQAVPYLVLFTVPTNPASWPKLNRVHQILEDSQSVAGAGEQTYVWQRGNVYLQVAHGLGLSAASPADAFSRFKVRVNQSDYLVDVGTDFLDMEARVLRGRAREAGTIPYDLLGTSGLGNFGLARDMFNSSLVTDLASIITATGASTLYTVRRQLLTLRGVRPGYLS
jgi:hypothetical protein